MSIFVGRDSEIGVAKGQLKQSASRIIVINGRRRIGKSTLAEKIAEGYRFFNFSGLSPSNTANDSKNQMDHFLRQLSKQTGNTYESGSDWYDVLCVFAKEIPSQEKIVILFDEISWLASGDPHFVGKLKTWWDQEISHGKNVLLIFCGSVSTWIEKNIINSTAFYGRISAVINLQPLSITDSVKLLKYKNFQGSPFEFYKILAVMGGIPWYLEQIDESQTADKNIENLCFKRNGLLHSEFEYIFNDVFSKYGNIYHQMLSVLSEGMKNLAEIRKAVNYAESGQLSNLMNNLIVSGFVTKHEQWNFKTCSLKKQSLYRLSDPYTRFYLKYIKPAGNLEKLPTGFESIIGIQMENLLIQNRKLIMNELNIDNVLRDSPYLQKASSSRRGCQIDYLIQTETNNLFLCEFKFRKRYLGNEIIDEVKEKMDRLVIPRGMAVVPVLFHIGEVSHTVYESRFFYKTIDLENFLVE